VGALSTEDPGGVERLGGEVQPTKTSIARDAAATLIFETEKLIFMRSGSVGFILEV
jgi:hypothetical protein